MSQSPTNNPAPRNYLRRREQLRIFILVMTLGLVVMLMFKAADPNNWVWLTGESPKEKTALDSESPSPSSSSSSNDEDYDTAYQPGLEPDEPLDTIRIVSDAAPMLDGDSRYFPGVVPIYLARVKDRRPHHPQETDAWYNLLGVLAANDSQLIRDASTGPVSFVQLCEQPAAYRGELVTIQCNVRRVEKISVSKNSAGIDGYYKLIVKPIHGPTRPMFLYVLELPDDFPRGDELHEDVEVTGFSYKTWPYLAKDLSWIAPVILARDLDWQPVLKSEIVMPPLRDILQIAAILAACAIGLTYVVYRTSRSMFGDLTHQKSAATRDEVEQLARVQPSPSIGHQLQGLADDDENP